MEDPLLETAQPDSETWGDADYEKLAWLSMFYGIKPDLIAQQFGSRSNLYDVMAGKRTVTPTMRQRVAEIVGFPTEAWDWPLVEFDQWIRDNYPGFGGRFQPTNTAA